MCETNGHFFDGGLALASWELHFELHSQYDTASTVDREQLAAAEPPRFC